LISKDLEPIFEKFAHFLIYQRNLKPTSATSYLREIEKLQDFIKVDVRQIKNYAEFSELLIKYRVEQELSDRSIYKVASMVKVYFDFLAMHEYVNSPHFLSMGHGFKKGKGEEPQFFDRDEDKSVIDKILWNPYITLRDRCILFLLYSTGLRRSELCGLNLSDIDTEKRWVHVRKTVGKGDKWRYVPYDEITSMWLSLYITSLHKFNQIGKSDHPLFLTVKGDRMTPQGVWKLLNNMGRSLGVKMNPHKWRHSLASFLTQKEDISYAAEVMGHDDIQTTKQYVHFKPATVKKIYDRLTASS